MVPFNRPCVLGSEIEYIKDVLTSNKLCGDGSFTRRCSKLIEEETRSKKVLITTSCSHGLDMAAMIIGLKPGDEVIMPSYTFVSTANAIALRGATPVFVDIRPDTMNIDESLIEAAINESTKAIFPVHYAGVGCEMIKIMEIAKKHRLAVVEDAAQGVDAYYMGQSLGTFGDLGVYSFHETKNLNCGEGGALLINRDDFIDIAEIIREKGTNRSRFFRGQVDKYTWVELGSSYLPSELNVAFLLSQWEHKDIIQKDRLRIWNYYYDRLADLEKEGLISLPVVPNGCRHNAHMFYIKVFDLAERTRLIEFLGENEVTAVFHYIPLHSAPAGKKYGRFFGDDCYTTKESNRLLRLPLYYGMSQSELDIVIDLIHCFYRTRDDKSVF